MKIATPYFSFFRLSKTHIFCLFIKRERNILICIVRQNGSCRVIEVIFILILLKWFFGFFFLSGGHRPRTPRRGSAPGPRRAFVRNPLQHSKHLKSNFDLRCNEKLYAQLGARQQFHSCDIGPHFARAANFTLVKVLILNDQGQRCLVIEYYWILKVSQCHINIVLVT